MPCVSQGEKIETKQMTFRRLKFHQAKTSEKCCINKYFTFQCVGSPSSSSVELIPRCARIYFNSDDPCARTSSETTGKCFPASNR